MNYRALLFTLISLPVFAQETVDISEMGKFTLEYTNVENISGYQAPPVMASVSYMPGDAMAIRSPINPQQRAYLVGNGQHVEQGQRIAKLAGSEVHHFQEQLVAQQAIVEQAESRFKKNQSLFAQQAISQERWQQILSFYYEQKVALGHLTHFAEIVEPGSHDDEMYLLAPVAGTFRHVAVSENAEDVMLGEIIAETQFRLSMTLPVSYASKVTELQVEGCQVGVDFSVPTASGLTSQIWSQPLPADCGLVLGQIVTLTPVVSGRVQRVPASSVFMLEGDSYVAIKNNETLAPVKVRILSGQQQGSLSVEAQNTLAGAQVLSRSVSALQGVLMGLGGE